MAVKLPFSRRFALFAAGGVALLFCAFLVAIASLQPASRDITEVRGIATPEALLAHCRDAIGEPRVEKVADGIYVAIGYDLANTIVVATDAGNVVIDPGMSPARAAVARAAVEKVAPGPTAAVVYTHSHIDHVGGASAWVNDTTQIWASANFRHHFVKQYGVYRPVETRRATRQFAAHVALDSMPCSALGRKIRAEDFAAVNATGAMMPTHTVAGRSELTVGGVSLELVEAHGETHDQLFVYLPQARVLLPGDNYYRAFPNLYTIRGTSPRPVDAWISSLDEMRRRDPVALVPSHTVPVRGVADVRAALTLYRDGIQWLRDQVIRAANRGDDVATIAAQASLPAHLAQSPALAPLYGQLDWSARAIYDNNLGWFDGRAEALYPLPPSRLATRLVEAMGGVEAVFASAGQADDPAWALYLLGQLRDSGAVDQAVGGRWALATAQALERQATSVGNTNGRGYLLETAHELRHGRDAGTPPVPPDALLDALPIEAFFDVMVTRLIPERSIDAHESVQFHFRDSGEVFVVTVRRGVAELVAGAPLPGTPEPIAAVTTTTAAWRRLALDALSPVAAVASGELRVSGDLGRFYTFVNRFARGL